MRYLIICILLFLSNLIFAVNYPVVMVIDAERHLLKFNSDGSITAKTNGSAVVPVQVYPVKMVADSDGHLLKFDSNGNITIKGAQ